MTGRWRASITSGRPTVCPASSNLLPYRELTLAWLLETGAHLAHRLDTIRIFALDSIELTETDVAIIRRWLECWSSEDKVGSRNGFGYRVLDALDDNRDRRLSGAGLAGIAVWFDRDSDAVSDAGEVVPVEELGIAALATEATETIGVSLGNPCGLELTDGRMLPTYDWFLEPVMSPAPE